MSTPSDDYACNETVISLPPLLFTDCDDMQTVVITLGVFLGVTFVTLATQTLFYAYRKRLNKTT